MSFTPTPNDPFAQQGGLNPEEQPIQGDDFPENEAPTRQRVPPLSDAAPAQPEGLARASEQAGNPSPPAGRFPSSRPPEDTPTQQANHPPARQPAHPVSSEEKASLPGQLAGVVGLLLLVCFFLPWSFTPDIRAATSQPSARIPTASHSGWSTANGLPLNGGATLFNLFPQLWLVLIGALALIAVAALLWLHRISQRLAAALITIISLFSLLLEILFLVQINSVQAAVPGRLNQTLYGVSWGFWLALVATLVALGTGASMLYQAYAPDLQRRPQAPRLPEGQQPYPTA